MKEDLKQMILGIVKGSILLVIAGAVFYCVYPKYYFTYKGGVFARHNKITGKVEMMDSETDWKEFREFAKENR